MAALSVATLSVISSLSLPTESATSCDSTTPRVRKPWHSLSNEDQLLYAHGFQALHREGTLVLFLESHDNANINYHVHGTPQNFFWHSYWLYELENSFRDLGGEYECFTLPYWDVSHDEAYWTETENPKIGDLPIYNSNLGGEGNRENNYCVEDEPWTVSDYVTEYLCADDEVESACCLKRFHKEMANATLASRHELADAIFVDKELRSFSNFSVQVNSAHEKIHRFVGSVSGRTHFSPDIGEPEVDPLFPLFHAFIDYLRLLREDCNQWDRVDTDDLDDYIPYSYSADTDVPLDYGMTFSVLCDGTSGERKRLCSNFAITPRFMFDVSPNTGWFNIVYELGEFWSENEPLKTSCAAFLNSTWWSVAETETDYDTDVIFADDSETVEKQEFVADRVLRSFQRFASETTVRVIVFMAIGMVIIALLRRQLSSRKKMVGSAKDEACHYGAV